MAKTKTGLVKNKKRAEDIHFDYDKFKAAQAEKWDKWANGQVVIKGKDVPFFQNRQAYVKGYSHFANWDTLAAPDWFVFIQRVFSHSGKHKHQGGIGIFVLDGKGYTIVDGVRYDWEKGDLIVFPVKPGGVEHQHFNLDPDKPSEWIMIQYTRFNDVIDDETQQIVESPDWKKSSSSHAVSKQNKR